MGLKDKLTSPYVFGGSVLSYNNGKDIPINPLATKDSKLHATKDGENGYSIDGSFQPLIASQASKYNDGINWTQNWGGNNVPPPSEIDNEVTYDGKKYATNISNPTKYIDNNPFGKETLNQLNYKP